MKKLFNKKNVFAVFMIICVIGMFNFAYADITTDWPSEGTANTKITNVAGNMWATVVDVVQILAVAAVVFAGLRYMFASADDRADIKKQLGYLVLGAVLVFCTTTVIKFISVAGNDILG